MCVSDINKQKTGLGFAIQKLEENPESWNLVIRKQPIKSG